MTTETGARSSGVQTVSAESTPVVADVTPKVVDSGATVTVTGSNFAPVVADNVVAVNGVRATVSSATATTLTFVAPAGTSGHVSVTTPGGTGTSTGYLFKPPGAYKAADVVSTGAVTPGGAAVQSSVGTAAKIGLVAFDGVQGRRVSLKVSGSTIPSAYVRIYRPDGVELANTSFGTSGGFVDVRTLPATGTYTILVDPNSSYTGNATLTLHDVPPDASGAIAPGGDPQTVTTTVPGQNAKLTFDGVQGRRISLKVTGSTLSQAYVRVYRPDGVELANAPFGTSGTFIDVKTLPATGTYSILVDPSNSYVGSATVTLYDVPPDATGAIAPGGDPQTVTTTVPGQNAKLTFDGVQGRRISLKVTSSTLSQAYVRIYRPDGVELANAPFGTSGTFVDVKTLPATGVYSILVDPSSSYVGNATLTLHDVPPDASGAIAPGGDPQTVTTTTPGQNAKLRFDGVQGRRISLKVTSSTLSQAYVRIYRPDGVELANAPFGTSGTFIDVKTLPATGVYSILVDPSNSYVGSATVALYDVPADAAGTIAPGGDPQTVTTTVPGQNAKLTFDGVQDRRVSLRVSNVTMTQGRVSILKPDGTALVGATTFGTSGVYLDVKTLPSTGTYSVVVDPTNSYTGAATVTLYDVPADTTRSIVAGGSPETVTATVPGQNAKLTFDGAQDQRVSLKISGVTMTQGRVSILRPDGTALVGATNFYSSGVYIDTKVLPVAGTYTIVVDPDSSNTGDATVALYDVPADAAASVAPGGDAQAVTTTVPGQNARVTFDGTQSRRVSLELTGSTFAGAKVSIVKPDGTNLVGPTSFGTAGTYVDTKELPATGSYVVVVDPDSSNTGTVTLELHDVPPDFQGTAAVGGEAATVDVAVPGQNAQLRFDATAGQAVKLRLADVTLSTSRVSVAHPDGTSLLAATNVYTSGRTFTLSITKSGTHVVTIDPTGAAIGHAEVDLYAGVDPPTIRSSSHPTQTEWYSKSQLDASWTPPSGTTLSGYAVVLDRSRKTIPGAGVTQAGTTFTRAGLADGTWWLHVRSIDASGGGGGTAHFKVNVDTIGPTITQLTSSTHPDPNQWYPDLPYDATWSASDASGAVGYSVVLDRSDTAAVDDVVDQTDAAVAGELPYGHEWHLLVRGKDKAGNWGPTGVLRIRGGVDVDPSIGTIPAEQPDDFSGTTTDGVNVRIDSAAPINPWDVTVSRSAEMTPRTASVMASPAYDVRVPDSAQFTDAVLTIPYRPSLLKGWPEGALRMYYFDEDRGLWVLASSDQLVDTDANTVSARVGHFSMYAVFMLGDDGLEQFWPTREVFCVQDGNDRNGVDVSLLIDTSGSMSSNDPSNQRVEAAHLFVDKMSDKDGAAVTGFSSSATRYIGLTKLDTAANRAAVHAAVDRTKFASGGTNIESAVQDAISILGNNGSGRARVALLLTDGGSSYNESTTSAARNARVTIHTVGFGSDDATLLRSIATGTGGTYRHLTTPQDLPNAYAEIAQTLIDDGTDTDGDGLTDCEETNGMLASSGIFGIAPDPFNNDRRVTSDPNDRDTDDDGLTDGEEMLGRQPNGDLGTPLDLRDFEASRDQYDFLIEAGITKYFTMRSNPNLEDTDGEGVGDFGETRGIEVDGRTITCRPDLRDTDMDGLDDRFEFLNGSDCRNPDSNEFDIPGLAPHTLFHPNNWSQIPVVQERWVRDSNGIWSREVFNDNPVVYDPSDNSCESNCDAINAWAQAKPEGDWCWWIFSNCKSDEQQVAELIENVVEQQGIFTESGALRGDYAGRAAVAECLATTGNNQACVDAENLKQLPDEINDTSQLDDWIAEVILNIPGGYRPVDLCGGPNGKGGVYHLVDDAGKVRYVGRTDDFARRESEHLRNPEFEGLRFDPQYRTDNYQVQRGLEQRAYNDQWGDVPIADARAQGSLNKQRPMDPNHRSYTDRLDLAQLFMDLCL
ncbi:MAG TPA: VWA domain-containing protein [Actinomycetota bacterium]|nr:VWA domain-containing protein [Actinomycetota bacterium]